MARMAESKLVAAAPRPGRVAGSFRDPSGQVFHFQDRILRTMDSAAAIEFASAERVMRQLVVEGRLVDFSDAEPSLHQLLQGSIARVLQHPLLEQITYPYEWSFAGLKAAALFHLQLQLDLLDQGFCLSDATAYNVQFEGSRPTFIDHLSIKPYRDGQLWYGHKQFCEQFLVPLLLRSVFDITHHSWYRGNLEGVPSADFVKLLSTRHWFSHKLFMHIILPAKLQSSRTSQTKVDLGDSRARRLPKDAFRAMLAQLYSWISGLKVDVGKQSVWQGYAANNTYTATQRSDKGQYVAEFVAQHKPRTIIDLGCNTGDFSYVALENGAEKAIGFDFDPHALDAAFDRSVQTSKNFLPLYLDARNPSPSQGWGERERQGFSSRFSADAVLALAFEHHLAIAHNVPLAEVVAWVTQVAPKGIIEFVPKEDETVRRMLAGREDIFSDYNEEAFASALSQKARVVRKHLIPGSKRTLYTFERSE
ncbi:nodulation protein NoeA [Sinorhizobium meliloti]|uniref:nodulation protein NoeA n=1 Tax=Rhizobium meliloti TaxID=382 RepID=UPI000FDA67EC|nr:nodulation protein NoeA [Sinorhizobium meliloti]MDE3820273.1 nodulation protein NoeA [Sinorhizobium meliloti]MDW9390928.1 nodulation protein NoeA [Sinorhizobium meliloti]MDW9436096.1 nodulation protein NoeA [Sinorhizobium meliloti]MDW9484115.1 nodulation protein NoeA [Sinorhizobium meliloti]MDW9596208.1 nodulation protein NoeA [Sinorhizobium meliloti]